MDATDTIPTPQDAKEAHMDTDSIIQQDKQVTVDVPEARVPEFYAWYARFLAGEGRGPGGRRGRGPRGRHGHGPHGHHRCGPHGLHEHDERETERPAEGVRQDG